MIIYAVSDQHGLLDQVVPPCDLLIVAGDNCPDAVNRTTADWWGRVHPELQLAWFHREWMAWRRKQPARHCIVTWGNHDFCGQGAFSAIRDLGDTHIVVDALVEFEGLKIWCSPWSKQFYEWAFMAEEHGLHDKFKAIPEDIDILVSHDPPNGFGDDNLNHDTGRVEHHGSKAVLWAVERVKPRIVISGHFHEGFGVTHIDLCDAHGASPAACECHTFRQVTVYNVAQAEGRASQGTLHDSGRGPVQIHID